MTFSQDVKSEIIKSVRNIKGCCAASFLTAVLKSSGSLALENKKFSFTVESENHEFLALCGSLAERELAVESKIESYNVNVKGAAVYSCIFDGKVGEKLGLITREDGALRLLTDCAPLIPSKPCCRKAFLQALFVSCGSVVIPLSETDVGENQLRAKYHLELRFTDADFARAVSEAYAEFCFRKTSRKNHTVLYLKDSEKIADALSYFNATKGRLKLENVIIGRSMRNNANRQSNCISANIEKSVVASEKQLAAIARLRSTGVFDTLSDQLKDIARIRQEFPEANLDEIAARLNISKSGASHRFAKIIELANQENK